MKAAIYARVSDGRHQDAFMKKDWTENVEGEANSSQLFLKIVTEVENIILSDASNLIAGRANATARLIVAKLAHGRWRMAPES